MPYKSPRVTPKVAARTRSTLRAQARTRQALRTPGKLQESGVANIPMTVVKAATALAKTPAGKQIVGRVLSSPGAKTFAYERGAGIPSRVILGNMARTSAKSAGKTVGASVANASKTQKAAVLGATGATSAYIIGKNMPRSGSTQQTGTSTSRQSYSGMKPNAGKGDRRARTGPGQSYVGSTVGARSTGTPMRPAGGNRGAMSGTVSAAIRQGRKQGPTKSEPTKTQPSQPKSSGKGGKASGGQVPGRPKGTSVRTFAVQQRLKLAEEAAKAGNYAAARNYAKAAANIQKRGTGGKASQKRVANVAKQYAKLAQGK